MTTQSITIKGERFILIPEADFDRLRASRAGVREQDLPPLPKPDTRGNVPALAYSRASIARKLIMARREAGLTQARLAQLAGVRIETINRLEKGKHSADVKTLDKIDAAIKKYSGSK